ncbi:protease, insulinase family/protease, insulinase family [hydrocarbon metagenome]|uniref:Protease, insulinase family/protease, insulinase family n=1 Tax=hydrocarbon metagenome TaxID=938273 RepID=A0A0W8FVZ4_9ZZZZ
MKVNREIQPNAGIPGQFKLPLTDNLQLENGLQIYHTEKHKLPIVKINLVIPAGSSYDGYGNEGLAYLTSLVLDEGAGNLNSLQLSDEIDKLGSKIDISTSVDHIFISLTSLAENFKRTLELFSLIVNEPQFNIESFEREKKKHITKIIQSFDSPEYLAANAFQKNIFKGSVYDKPILGYANSVETITLQQIRDFYSRYFLNNDMSLISVGAIPSDDLTALFEKYLGNIILKPVQNSVKIEFQKNAGKIYFINKEGAAQSEIVAGHLIKDRNATDYLAAKVANTILGGQFSSRINLNLRENKGYTYGANSGLSYNKFIGYFTVSTSVQSEYTIESIKEIRKEINFIREEIREDEIAFAKSYLIKQFPSMSETYSQVLQQITTKTIYHLEDFYDHYIQDVWDLTHSEILNSANEYFIPELLSFFVVGDKEKIYESLRTIDDLQLIELDKLGNKIN